MIIETANGHTILADDADYPLLGEYGWHVKKSGGGRLYACARIKGTSARILMHRFLMKPPEGMIVHHRNNNGLDNRRRNLMITTQNFNIRVAKIGRGAIYQIKGRWRAQARDETGKRVSLRTFDSKEAALAVVQNWRYHKMLELEERSDQESKDLAAGMWDSLEMISN